MQVRQSVDAPDTDLFKGVFLYNTKNNAPVTYLDYIDPIQEKKKKKLLVPLSKK